MGIAQSHFVIGTAGHIDHGKTAMVKQLTGRDTDWLKEEKARGMTIDLGFAFLGDEITIIDVPGHEKFIRNMVAGVSTIDLVLFVIAADDGIMPQSREHLEILKLLQIKRGIIVITKIDLVEKDWLDLVIEDVKDFVKTSFLENAPIIPISSVTGSGIDRLKEEILKEIQHASERTDRGIFRMPVDRVFTIKGFGTIVAGTVLSGRLKVDQMVELLPQRKKMRVRNIQIHEQNVSEVKIGDRAALNLVGIEKETVKRGNVIAAPEFYQPTQFLDARFYLLKSAPAPLKHNDRIHLHVGTEEVIAKVRILEKEAILPGEESLIQMKLEKEIVADRNDRFVARRFSPVETIGGGVIIDAHPQRHKRFDDHVLQRIEKIEKADDAEYLKIILSKHNHSFLSVEQLAKHAILPTEKVMEILASQVQEKSVIQVENKNQYFYYLQSDFDLLKKKTLETLEKFHEKNPTRRGLNFSELQQFLKVKDALLVETVLSVLQKEGVVELSKNVIRLKSQSLKLTDKQKKMTEMIAEKIYEQAFTPQSPEEFARELGVPNREIDEYFRILLESGKIVKVEQNIYFHIDRIKEAQKKLRQFFEQAERMTVAEFRQMINSSRKYALPLLNYFDSKGLTIRQEEFRVLNPDYRESD